MSGQATDTTHGPAVIVVRLDKGGAGVGPVLTAATHLFGPRDPVRLVSAVDHEPPLDEAEAIARLLAEAAGGLDRLPETDIVGPDGLAGLTPLPDVPADCSAADTAGAVLTLAALAALAGPAVQPRPSGPHLDLRAERDAR